MEVKILCYNSDSFGITQKSLKILRNTLAANFNKRIAVVRVPTNDLCCGYFVFDLDGQRATWSGDGFRMDEQGEGGAGEKSAKVLLSLFGIIPYEWEPVDFEFVYYDDESTTERVLKKLAQKIADTIMETLYSKPSESIPGYVRR